MIGTRRLTDPACVTVDDRYQERRARAYWNVAFVCIGKRTNRRRIVYHASVGANGGAIMTLASAAALRFFVPARTSLTSRLHVDG